MSASVTIHLDAGDEPLSVKVRRVGQTDMFGVLRLSRDDGTVDLIINTLAGTDRLLEAVVDLRQQLAAGGAS
jgi:hypothetical protein